MGTRLLLVGLAATAGALIFRPATPAAAAPRRAVVDGTTEAAPPSVAAMLSLNARGVNARTVAAAREALGAEHVFATASLDEARDAAATIRARGYDAVLAGGGDGTLSSTIQFLADGAESLADLPAIAALPLGTGNAVARYVCGKRFRRWGGVKGVRKAAAFLKDRRDIPTIDVPVMRVDSGELCFLAGQGFDAFILDDYKRIVEATNETVLSKPLRSVAGYFVATALRTLPGYLSGRRRMRVRVESPGCAWVDARRGDAALAVAPGTIYEGRATIVAGGSTPFYGGGLRLFPFARAGTAPLLHLRVARMSPWKFVPNILGIFSGHYRHENEALDFLGDEFTVTLLDGKNYPFQQSGDAMGVRQKWTLDVAGAVRFVDVLGPPPSLRRA